MHLRIHTKKQFSIKCTPRQKTLFSPFLLHRQNRSLRKYLDGGSHAVRVSENANNNPNLALEACLRARILTWELSFKWKCGNAFVPGNTFSDAFYT